ncbi:substrate-binding domain-containing protein [Marinicella rhabdoformis]|uniref:substrate-binding domain-containing protein n=1 Tax=Marinicella rhabdoformis TaxID=2580566 RepID=UPI0012AEDAED|nr:substrate-binding domain-containing protein [Marinicella rhabdoformis]
MIRLRIGGVPEHYNLPWHMALKSGELEAKGIKAEWTDFYEGTGGMIQAIKNEELDMAILLTEGAISGISRSANYKIVSFYTDSPIIWGIHVPAESDIHDVNEIYHHRYAISRYGSGSHLMPYVHARQQDWPVHKLQFRVINNLDGARLAFKEEKADVFFWEKFTTKPYVDSGEFRRIGECPTPWSCFVVVASQQTLALHADKVKALLETAFGQAQKLTADPDKVEKIAQLYDLKSEDVAEWLSYTKWSASIDLKEGVLNDTTETLKDLGLVHQKFTPKNLYHKL